LKVIKKLTGLIFEKFPKTMELLTNPENHKKVYNAFFRKLNPDDFCAFDVLDCIEKHDNLISLLDEMILHDKNEPDSNYGYVGYFVATVAQSYVELCELYGAEEPENHELDLDPELIEKMREYIDKKMKVIDDESD